MADERRMGGRPAERPFFGEIDVVRKKTIAGRAATALSATWLLAATHCTSGPWDRPSPNERVATTAEALTWVPQEFKGLGGSPVSISGGVAVASGAVFEQTGNTWAIVQEGLGSAVSEGTLLSLVSNFDFMGSTALKWSTAMGNGWVT